MTTVHAASPFLSAEEAGRRFLKLIESIHSRDDLTIEHVQTVMGVALTKNDNQIGAYYTQSLGNDWRYDVSLSHQSPPGKSISLTLEFIRKGDRIADMSEFCNPTFEEYHKALEQLGYRSYFDYDTIDGQVGRLLGVIYRKENMNVGITPEVRRFPNGKLYPTCARSISLQLTK